MTRFLVMSPEPRTADPQGGPVITSFVFRVRNVPAALYKALGGFATNGVNMTKLESYMIEGTFTAAQFYADIEGHPEERPVRLALEELSFFSREVQSSASIPRTRSARARSSALLSSDPISISTREMEFLARQRSVSFSGELSSSSRVNQRAVSSSSVLTLIRSSAAVATKPSISEAGNGQGCEAK